MPPKVVGMLCLLQVFAIMAGYLLTRSAYKFYPATVEMLGSHARPLAWETKLMLAIGPWLLVLPLAWAIVVTMTANTEGGIAEASRKQTVTGYVLSLALALFCFLSVVEMWYSLTRMKYIPYG